jgi:hypothetical protein
MKAEDSEMQCGADDAYGEPEIEQDCTREDHDESSLSFEFFAALDQISSEESGG